MHKQRIAEFVAARLEDDPSFTAHEPRARRGVTPWTSCICFLALGWVTGCHNSIHEGTGSGGSTGSMAQGTGGSGSSLPDGGSAGGPTGGGRGGGVYGNGGSGGVSDGGHSGGPGQQGELPDAQASSSGGDVGSGGGDGGGGNDAGGGSDAGGSTGGHDAQPSDGGDAGPSPDGAMEQADAGRCPFATEEFFLWTGTAPGSEGVKLTEQIKELSTNPAVHLRQITDVTRPSIFPYLAPQPNGAAALIMPGGAYSLLSFDLEGADIAKWLNSLGVSAFIVKYRLPADYPQAWIALADAQRAMRVVRDNAGPCGIDPVRLGVVGFSAGGHLASQLETRPTGMTSPKVDRIDDLDARPDFGILLYPVISMDPSIVHTGSRNNLLGSNPSSADLTLWSSEKQVTSSTPPTFIGVSKKDTGVNPKNSMVFDDALKAAGVPEELHLYNDGAHGTGIRDATGDMAAWPAQASAWLAKMKLTTAGP